MKFKVIIQIIAIHLFIFLVAVKSFSYPEMIRHGYVNCEACHASHQGGDLLTTYGHALSEELLTRNDSIFENNQNQEQSDTLKLKTPEWLQIGSHARLLQTFTDNTQASKARFMIMQLDLDTLIKLDQINNENKEKSNWNLYLSVGRFENSESTAEWKDFVYNSKAWLRYQMFFKEGSEVLSLRLGRFFPTYGLNLIEHSYVNRRYLGFNPGQEHVGFELAWLGLDYQIVASQLFQQAQFQKYKNENGQVIQISKVISQKAKAGINLFNSVVKEENTTESRRRQIGAYALIGWNEKLSTLVQLDQITSETDKKGLVDFIRFGYEYIKGLQLFATQEYANFDVTKTDPHIEAYGLGLQYFPRPNIDFFVTYKKQKDSSQIDEFQDIVWLISHFYF